MKQLDSTTNEARNRLLSEYCKKHDIPGLIKIPDYVDELLGSAEFVLTHNINRTQRYNQVISDISLANIALRQYCRDISSLPLDLFTDERIFILKKPEDATKTCGANGFRKLKHTTDQLPYNLLSLSMILAGELKLETYRIALQKFKLHKQMVDDIHPILKGTNEILLDIAMRCESSHTIL